MPQRLSESPGRLNSGGPASTGSASTSWTIAQYDSDFADTPWYVIGADTPIEEPAFLEIGPRLTSPLELRTAWATVTPASVDDDQRDRHAQLRSKLHAYEEENAKLAHRLSHATQEIEGATPGSGRNFRSVPSAGASREES